MHNERLLQEDGEHEIGTVETLDIQARSILLMVSGTSRKLSNELEDSLLASFIAIPIQHQGWLR